MSTLTTSNPGKLIGVRFVSDEVKRDHRDLEILYKGLVQAMDDEDAEAAAKLQDRFAWDLARHLAATQLLICPGTESRADEGNERALKRREELAEIRDRLLDFVHLAPGDAGFRPAAEELGGVMDRYVRDVEKRDLRAVEGSLDGDESERMARDWERTARFVPGGGEKGAGGQAPFATVDAMLRASLVELQAAWDRLPGSRCEGV